MYDVLIAGWGPTGMIAANVIGRAGHRVAVFERHPGLYPLPRVGGVHDDIVRVFQELGFIDEIWPDTYIPTTYDMVQNGQILFRSPMSPAAVHGWPQMVLMFQPYFEAQLDGAARAAPHVDVFHNSNVVGLAQSSDGVEITIEDTNSEARRAVRGRYLIGCDGGNSFIRQTLGIDQEHLGFDQDWLVVDAVIKKARPDWPVLVQLCNPELPGMSMQLGRHHRRWAFMIMPGETKEEATQPESIWRRLAAIEGSARATSDDVSLIRHVSYRFTSLLTRIWQVGRTFLAGDAAHQMPPFLGQGMSSGIRDAYNLGHKLALVLSGHASERLLESYEQERKPGTRSAIEESVRVGRVVVERDPVKVAKRNADLKAAQARTSAQLVGYRPPPFTGGCIGRPEAGARGSGQVFVQGIVGCGGKTGRFDDLVGRGFMIVMRSGDAAALGGDHRAFWRALGGRIATFGKGRNGDIHFDDRDGWYGEHMDEFGCDVMIKRSDFCVFGMYPSNAELPAGLDDLRAQLLSA